MPLVGTFDADSPVRLAILSRPNIAVCGLCRSVLAGPVRFVVRRVTPGGEHNTRSCYPDLGKEKLVLQNAIWRYAARNVRLPASAIEFKGSHDNEKT
jgi:hypothetical protein